VRSLGRKTIEDPSKKHYRVNITLSAKSVELLKTLPERDRSRFIDNTIIEKLGPKPIGHEVTVTSVTVLKEETKS